MLKKLKLPNGLQQSILKGNVREGHPRVRDQLVRTSLADDEEQGCVSGVNIINP